MILLQPTSGGHNFRVDDLIQLQNSIKDAAVILSSVLRYPYSTSPLILSGINLLGISPTVINDGYLLWDGELFFVEGGSSAIISGGLFFGIEETILPPSPTLYEDNTLQNVHVNKILKLRTKTISDISYPAVGYNGFDAGTLLTQDRVQGEWGLGDLKTIINNLYSPWTNVVFNSNNFKKRAGDGVWNVTSTNVKRNRCKIIGKTLYWDLHIEGSSIDTDSIQDLVLVLPETKDFVNTGSIQPEVLAYASRSGSFFDLFRSGGLTTVNTNELILRKENQATTAISTGSIDLTLSAIIEIQ